MVRCPSEFLIDEKAFPPLGLLTVATALRDRGHEVCVHDGQLEDIPFGYDVYGFGPVAPEYPAALSGLRRIRQRSPRPRVILGGTHATLNVDLCRSDGFDCIVVGDGEVEADRALTTNDPILYAESLPLDGYPFPDRTLMNIHAYRGTLDGMPSTTMVTARGCGFQCGFCCKNTRHVRMRSAEKVNEEIRHVRTIGFESVTFSEELFILNRPRAQAIFRCLKDLGMIWRCQVRADVSVHHGAEFLRTMAQSGCTEVGMGIESGSDHILRTINKGETVATIRRGIQMYHDVGIRVRGYLIVGLPGETTETLDETRQFLATTPMADVDIKVFQPYPGSPIYDERDRYDISWDPTPLADTFYKGRPGDYRGSLRTAALSTEQIVSAWKELAFAYEKRNRRPC